MECGMSGKFSASKLLGAFMSQERGSAVVTIALAMPVVVGAAGFGVETSYWYYEDLKLQAAADAAANAAAIEKRSGSDYAQVSAEAAAVAIDNGFESTLGTIEVYSPPKSGSFITNRAVEVILKEKRK